MLSKAQVNVIGKDQQNYIDSNGTTRSSYLVNIFQDGGKIIDSIRVSEEYFSVLEPGKEYVFEMASVNGKSGMYLRTLSVYPAK